MNKAYSRVKWEDYPSVATPLNEENLNKMDMALDEVDNRVLGLDTVKLDKSTANTMVKDVDCDEKTGIFTITLLDGTTKTIDTGIGKIATNFRYDYESQKLVLILIDGTEQELDLSSLISQNEFTDSDTISLSVDSNGKVSGIVKDGSITEEKLQPNFLADVKVEVAKAESFATSAYENATIARESSQEAKQYRDETEQFRNEVKAIVNVEIATTDKAGIVKPDGTTITVDADGTISATAQSGVSSWNDLTDKPFDTVGSGLSASDGSLAVDFTKVQQVESGKGLSTNDYTDADADKLAGVEENANNYSLPIADADTLGGIKPDGTTITVDGNGVASVVGGGGSVDVLDTYEEIMANTTSGKVAGGLGVKEGFETLNKNLGMYGDVPNCYNASFSMPLLTGVDILASSLKSGEYYFSSCKNIPNNYVDGYVHIRRINHSNAIIEVTPLAGDTTYQAIQSDGVWSNWEEKKAVTSFNSSVEIYYNPSTTFFCYQRWRVSDTMYYQLDLSSSNIVFKKVENGQQQILWTK